MPNLYPGIKPSVGSGRLCVLLFTTLFVPFLVFAQPVITSFSPQSGAVGSTVTITGSNFGATPTANIVYFGAVKATVTAASTTSLSVTVPAGASYQALTVSTGSLTAYAAKLFDITFADGGQFIPAAFQDRWDFGTGQNVQSIYTTDIDGDGKSDLIALAADDYKLQVFKNASTGSALAFSAGVNVNLPVGYYGAAVTAGDLDGDGKPDIVVGTFTNLLVYRNTSTPGSFSLAAPLIYSAGTQPQGLAIRDLDGDGKPEIVVGALADNTITIFQNTTTAGTLSFNAMAPIPFPATAIPYNLVVADLDGDGKPDIATVDNYTNSVAVWQNTTVGAAISFHYDPTNDFPVGSGPQDIKAADLDGDGKIDLAVVNTNDATVTLLQNTSTPGSFSFSRGTDVPTGGQFPGSPIALLITDFDGDGNPDIAVANNMEQTISIHRNISTPGTPAIDVNVDYVTGDVPWGLASADFDGDGLPDLANIDNSTNLITLLRNKSSSATSITSFTPTAGSAGTVVTITGSNFTGATAVSFGGTPAASFTVVSATTITATIGSGATGVVQVLAPGGTPTKGTFTYGVPSPTISNFTPTSGSPGTMITINGTHFTGTTSVSFGGVPAASFTVLSDNQISAVVGNGNSGDVGVVTASGSPTLGTFTYIPPAIVISSFSPQTGTTGSTIVIRGHGFLNATAVSFGGVACQPSFTINGDTSIVAIVASGATGDVLVSSSGSSDSEPGFTFTNAPPPPPPLKLVAITSFTPTNGSAGDTVYIYGANLSTATSVSFGGTPALIYRAVNDSQMIAVIGAGSTGAIRIANNTNADSLRLFTYVYDTTKTAAPSFQLITFSGALAGNNDPHLQWQVRNDGSISSYVIERSSDSILFSVIGTVKSTRTNGTAHTYSFTDPDPSAGVNWYRLKMQDTTAKFTYSTKIRLQAVSQLMPVYPNPVKYGFFYVDIPDANSASYIHVVDMAGHTLQSLNLSPGTATIRVNVPELAAGTYRVTWTNGKSIRSTTILVLKP